MNDDTISLNLQGIGGIACDGEVNDNFEHYIIIMDVVWLSKPQHGQ